MISSSTSQEITASFLQMLDVSSQREKTVPFPYLVAEIAKKYCPKTSGEVVNLTNQMVRLKEHRFDVATPLSLPITYMPMRAMLDAAQASTSPGPKLYARF
jgi:hypothetical protein